jgi:hypothetical protein
MSTSTYTLTHPEKGTAVIASGVAYIPFALQSIGLGFLWLAYKRVWDLAGLYLFITLTLNATIFFNITGIFSLELFQINQGFVLGSTMLNTIQLGLLLYAWLTIGFQGNRWVESRLISEGYAKQ